MPLFNPSPSTQRKFVTPLEQFTERLSVGQEIELMRNVLEDSLDTLLIEQRLTNLYLSRLVGEELTLDDLEI